MTGNRFEGEAFPQGAWLARLAARHSARGSFTRNVAVLLSGTVVAQAITLAAAPILSRLFPPAAFGALGVFSSVAGVAAVVANLRYEAAVVLPKSDDEAANLLALCGLMTLSTATLALALIALGGRWVESVTRLPGMGGMLWWLPPFVVASGLYQGLNYWSTRKRQFSRLSYSRVMQSASGAGLQTGFRAFGNGGGELIGGWVLGQSAGTLALGYQVWREDASLIRSAWSWARIRRLAAEYRDFPIYSAPQGLLNALSQGLPALFLAPFFGASTVGLYVLAQRLLQVPINLIGNSVRQALFPRVSEAFNTERGMRSLFAWTTGSLAAAGLFPTLAIILWGPALFAFTLGGSWTESGEFARWLVLWLFFGLVNIPSVVVAQVYRKQKQLLLFDSALLAARATALLVGSLTGSAKATVILFALIGVLFNVALIFWISVVVRSVESCRH